MVDPKETEWVSNGVTHKVTTRKGDMSDTEWCRVHDEAVAYWQTVFPPD